MADAPTKSRKGLLNALGLHRRELRAWAMYDWAVSSMQTVITTAVFPIYFIQVAGATRTPEAATQSLGYANTVAAIVIALLAPILGAVADFKAAKKRFLFAFMAVVLLVAAAIYSRAQDRKPSEEMRARG